MSQAKKSGRNLFAIRRIRFRPLIALPGKTKTAAVPSQWRNPGSAVPGHRVTVHSPGLPSPYLFTRELSFESLWQILQRRVIRHAWRLPKAGQRSPTHPP